MKKIDLGQTIGILANLGVIAGIAFLAYELRQNTLITKLDVVQSYSENLAEVNYFIAGDEKLAILLEQALFDPEFDLQNLGPGESFRLLSFWTAQLREWESTYNVLVSSGMADELESSFRGNVAFYMSRDRFIYPTWNLARDTFSDEFNELVEAVADQDGI